MKRGVYRTREAAFHLPDFSGNPFAAEAWTQVERPDDRVVRVAAFYGGEGMWLVRYTPAQAGRHRFGALTVTDEAGRAYQPVEPLGPAQFAACGEPVSAGFVRRSAERTQQFVLDSGEPFFPLGQNVAWATPDAYETYFANMAQAGLNWSRVWMAHWAGLNLDWRVEAPLEPGTLDLEVARRWDQIIDAAERHGLRVQLVLQHHGQYSTKVNANWNENPWNQAKGGFLERPADFFSDERARRLTRQKFRYIVARWGYSPAIMAWELFNEVEFTDAYARGEREEIARWHDEMAAWLRQCDAQEHLITTSSVPLESPLWASMDYYQLHRYKGRMLTAVSRFPKAARELDKPIFYGEMGDHEIKSRHKDDGRFTRSMIWASLLAGGAGAGQVWSWGQMHTLDFYRHYAAVARFAEAAGLGQQPFEPIALRVRRAGAPGLGLRAPLSALGARAGQTIALWAFHRTGLHKPGLTPASGLIEVPCERAGRCQVTWWGTDSGEPFCVQELQTGTDGELTLATPPLARDAAAIIRLIA